MGGEDEGSPPSSPVGDGTSGKTCEHCGAQIETSDWYPVTNDRDPDGSLRLYEFCSEDCQAAWRDETTD